MDPTFFEVTRTGEVLSRLTADTTLVQSISGVGISIALRSALTLVGSLVMLVATSPMLTLMIVVLMPLIVAPLLMLGRRVRHALARFAGSRRRRERARGRDDQRGADGAGVHARGVADAALQRGRDAFVQRGRDAHPDPRLAHRARDDAGVRRDHARAVDRRASGAGRHAHVRSVEPVPAVRRVHGRLGGVAVGDVGRSAARRRRDGTPRRARVAPSRTSKRRPCRCLCRARAAAASSSST